MGGTVGMGVVTMVSMGGKESVMITVLSESAWSSFDVDLCPDKPKISTMRAAMPIKRRQPGFSRSSMFVVLFEG